MKHKIETLKHLNFWKHGTPGTLAGSHYERLQILKKNCLTSFKIHRRTGKSVRTTDRWNKLKQRLESREQAELWGWAAKASAELSKLEFSPCRQEGRSLGRALQNNAGPKGLYLSGKKMAQKKPIWNLGTKWRGIKFSLGESVTVRWPPNGLQPKFTHYKKYTSGR